MSDTPYSGGTSSGWSGSPTSRDRAQREDSTGVTGRRSRQVLALLTDAEDRGMTDAEVQDVLGVGHGVSSGALTRLHKAGRIARLAERRSGNEIYVVPASVGDRPVRPYRPNIGTTDKARIEALESSIRDARKLIEAGRLTQALNVLQESGYRR